VTEEATTVGKEWRKYLDDNPNHPENKLKGAGPVSAEQMEAIALLEKMHARDMAKREKKAKFKIEVSFGKDRTPTGQPRGNIAVVSVYESGKRFDGGGDVMAYWCDRVDEGSGLVEFSPGRKRAQMGCRKVITEEFITHATVPTKDHKTASIKRAVCPHCHRQWNAGAITGQVYGRWTSATLARVLSDMWVRLDGDADIYLKYHYTDIRCIAMERNMGTAAARAHRGAVIYPLQNIMKDTSGGASIENRLKVFVEQ